MWIVVTQYSAFEINYATFEDEEVAKKYFNTETGHSVVHCFLAEVKEKY